MIGILNKKIQTFLVLLKTVDTPGILHCLPLPEKPAGKIFFVFFNNPLFFIVYNNFCML